MTEVEEARTALTNFVKSKFQEPFLEDESRKIIDELILDKILEVRTLEAGE